MDWNEQMPQGEIEEIERSIHDKETLLLLIKPRNEEIRLPSYENFEEVIRSDYLSKLSDDDRRRLVPNSFRKFNDARYEGDLLNDKRHGYGKMTYENGRIYTGEWRNDYRQGRGIEQYSNGNKYIGEFHNGKAQGVGIYT